MKKLVLCFFIFLFSLTANSQNLTIFNVDASAFPNVKANFSAFDASWNQQNPDKSEVIIKENGLTRTVLNVTCSTPIKPLILSCVLVMDISNSTNGKNIGIAKAAAQAWVNALPTDKSECALTTFNHFNYFNQDFTTDKNKLLTAINNLSYGDGTDYNKALIDSMCGGLRATKTGKYQKILVLLTDGLSSTVTDVSKIVAEAKLQKCKIYVVTLDMKCPKELKDITTQTGGQYFENVASESKAIEIYRTILKIAQSAEPCSVLWKSIADCDTSDINVDFGWKAVNATANYPTPSNAVHKLEVRPTTITFGAIEIGKYKDSTIKLAAKDVDYTISSIKLKYGSTAFQIKNVTFPLTIPKNSSYNIPIRYTPTDSNLCYGGFEIVTNYCSSYFSCTGGFPIKPMKQQTLKLTHPNGGESFYFNSDTVIAWDGVVPSDTVTLEYSVDNGSNWNLITDKATGLKYIWKNVPKSANNICLVRVRYGIPSSELNLVWEKTYGGSLDETCLGLQQTKDGGFILVGCTNSNDGDLTQNKGQDDFWVVKVNSIGKIEWQKSLGGSETECANSVQQTVDGGYIVAGMTLSSNGDVVGHKGSYDLWIVKFKPTGDIEWKKTFGGSGSEEFPSIKITTDGGYIVAASTRSNDGDVTYNHGYFDMWIFKLNSSGIIEWQKTYGGSNSDGAYDINLTQDGGYIVAGGNQSADGDCNKNNGIVDCWVVKLNSIGAIQWQKSFGGSLTDAASSIQKTEDGGYIVVGHNVSSDGDCNKNNGETDYWIVKLNSIGAIQWQNSFGGSFREEALSIQQTKDGGYFVAGNSTSIDGDLINNTTGMKGAWLVKLKSTGIIEWQKIIDKTDARAFEKTKDGGFIIGGAKNTALNQRDFWIAKLNYQNQFIQSDQSDAVFSIIEPKFDVNDVDMKNCLTDVNKDSIVTDLIKNIGDLSFTVDSIYFRGADAKAFSLVSSLPKYEILPNTWHSAELRFAPKRSGIYNAEMVIIAQSDTLVLNITGEGIEPQLSIESEIVDFGKVNLSDQRDTLQVLTIKNITNKALSITNTKINGPNLTDFKTIATVTYFTLQPDETKKIDLRFQPSDVGRTSGILAFYYDGVGSPAEVQLYGEGVAGDSQDLVSPANDTINIPIDCKMIWKPNTAYNSYNLQVSKDGSFTDITIDTTTKLTNYKFTSLDFFHTYYWRVKAIVGSDQSNWSPVWKFTTLMDTVKLTAPADSSKNQYITLGLSWERGNYPASYKLLLSTEEDFKDIDENNPNYNELENNVSYANLKSYTTYYWKVRYRSLDTLGYWSKTWQFKTRMSGIELIYPANKQNGLAQEINFKWSDCKGAEYYQLQISKNKLFTNMVYSKDSITTTEKTVPNLEKDILYYWHVRVWNKETNDPEYWSGVWTFRTGASGVADESDMIQITPNPAGDFITLESSPTPSRCWTSGEIQIYNTLGEKVMSVETKNFSSLRRINISDLPKGIYFLKVGSETAKFVKM
ncbi:MAG: choice-of-anchor D domain-containing protein [bacterium]